jgi:hypothetical protein
VTHLTCKSYISPALLVFFAVFLPSRVGGQPPDRSPESLIRFLTYESDRPGAEALAFQSCAIDQRGREDRAAVRLLVGQGEAAELPVRLFLESLETGERGVPPNAGWLLLSYAEIKGPAAFPLLWTLHASAKLSDLAASLDYSIALSLGLTSYVSSSQEPGLTIPCRGQQPRDALDSLIRSWQKGDLAWLEASLGPNARLALSTALKDKTWPEFRGRGGRLRAGDVTAVGYHFNIHNVWSEPELKLEDYREISVDRPELDTEFTSRSGSSCGKLKLSFAHVPKGDAPAYLNYLVDNTDVLEILHLVSSCAAKP